ncbi:S1C family serine protease [Brevibacillus porteri]|uniref:Serine protease n=1 Tax=Brevibacillus porteri TaxID=2126350 RepID=A0ABX5FMV1_9BACL|nr:trypsin-like peptidase domain-containing protein [Brevibacillus porteri]MED1799945.1 trypsin-like peptidase domain-containing protein [Brevibacillus porteri]MED2132968.1 trypsin-like peptidase domain-containing protein [Brevibacillus porteri]MED2744120.1 trypsin-like peptidase domain-containing protein [Brevibacillus porteri]MED2816840.1 trypsin-like peptidase domain-containing protein [Brevibacillus porteri]MED2894415.1 trypsin-like peptidase domain-containing protein [Brevibacillus porter
MGFYDDLTHVERKKQRGSSIGRMVVTSVTSAVIGGMVVLLTLPTLSNAGYINMVKPGTENALSSNASSSNPFAKPVSVSVGSGTVDAVKKVENAIVGVINIGQRRNSWMQNSMDVEQGQGSGVIFEKKGGKAYIVTNYHVIDKAQKLEVALPTGEKVAAKVVGADGYTDLAVLEIDGSKVTDVAEFGDSSTLQVGEPAIAIGNPLGMQFSRTVTQGIISSKERSMPMDFNEDGQDDWELDVIQTDAAINPGNSGGALVNIEGQVIGINTLKISKAGVEGLGFALPINDVKVIVDQLMEKGTLARSYLGVQPLDLANVPRYEWKETLNLPDNVNAGVVVQTEVGKFSPAGEAGLRQFDVIVKLDDKNIFNSAQLRKYLTMSKKPGDTMEVTYYRDGIQKTAKVKLTAPPQQ